MYARICIYVADERHTAKGGVYEPEREKERERVSEVYYEPESECCALMLFDALMVMSFVDELVAFKLVALNVSRRTQMMRGSGVYAGKY